MVYPGVHHGFMSPDLAEGRFIQSARGPLWLQYDDAAGRDALARAKAFLAKHLD